MLPTPTSSRVTATPEEVIIDFCLNPNPFSQGRSELDVSHRLIMNFYTAKRLFSALAMTLQRHEGTFGPIELDVQRAFRPSRSGSRSARPDRRLLVARPRVALAWRFFSRARHIPHPKYVVTYRRVLQQARPGKKCRRWQMSVCIHLLVIVCRFSCSGGSAQALGAISGYY